MAGTGAGASGTVMVDPAANGWMETQSVVAANVRAEIGRRDWSQRKLAECAGITESKVSRLLHGKADWWFADLYRISKAFEWEIIDLFRRG